jgi:hypothetical protein
MNTGKGLLQIGAYPKVVSAVYIPLHQIPLTLGEVRLEPMGFGNLASLLVASLLICLVMAMSGIELDGTCQ